MRDSAKWLCDPRQRDVCLLYQHLDMLCGRSCLVLCVHVCACVTESDGTKKLDVGNLIYFFMEVMEMPSAHTPDNLKDMLQ